MWDRLVFIALKNNREIQWSAVQFLFAALSKLSNVLITDKVGANLYAEVNTGAVSLVS